ncbi:MAG: signal peptidase I [Planctomycetes bacterium]|nr:signal peptidase I [Planctomycetota bacterium]
MEVATQRAPGKPERRPTFTRVAWALGTLVVLVLFVRAFVGDVYRVDSGSMAPTLWGSEGGGEWVFVRFTDTPPARHEVVVAQRAGERAPVVKRVVGLPGENVLISGGDVLVNGRRLAPSEPRPPWVLVFDPAVRSMESAFPIPPGQSALWRAMPDGVDLDARTLEGGGLRGALFFRDAFLDDYLGPSGELVRGESPATDARVEVVVTSHEAGSRFRIGLTEQGDTFQAHIRRVDAHSCEVQLTRRNAQRTDARGRQVEVTLASAVVGLPAGVPRRVAFENRDDVLRLEVEGAEPLVAPYRENVPFGTDEFGERRSAGYRVWLAGEGGRFEFRRVRVLRDLSYTEHGLHGVTTACELGPDEYFLLGDLSSRSRDSREWGAVRRAEIVGRPAAVVWPPARWRRLDGR